ncbi:MAG: spore protease YyaC [Firmicutes bacterium]|nr:spore protease YyaC [Bacillota bacterium]
MSTNPGHIWQKTRSAYRINSSDLVAVEKIKSALQYLLDELYFPQQQQLIVLCIGTDRSTGDALGPLIGTQLTRIHLPQTTVLGTLDQPVHAVNLVETIATIRVNHDDPFIIAVDACLGRADSIESVDIGIGPIRPGAGVSKDLPAVGEIHINGIVNVGGFLEYYVLQNTRLSVVVRLAETIACGIALALHSIHSTSNTKCEEDEAALW